MFYLDELTIKNVRSYRNKACTIAFSRTLTVITGHNGSGKTTLLEVITYLLSQDKPNYKAIEPKTAVENDTMLMRCTLCQRPTKIEDEPETGMKAEQEKELIQEPGIRKQARTFNKKQDAGNVLLFEGTRKIKRTGTAITRWNKAITSPEIVRSLQEYDGFLRYCLMCSVERAGWMFEAPEEINRYTDKILNVDYFAGIAKGFGPSSREIDVADAHYKEAFSRARQLEGRLVNITEDTVQVRRTKTALSEECGFINGLEKPFADIEKMLAKLAEQLSLDTSTARKLGDKIKFDDHLSLSLFYTSMNKSECEHEADHRLQCILSYLDVCTTDTTMSALYREAEEVCRKTSLQKVFNSTAVLAHISQDLIAAEKQVYLLQTKLSEAEAVYNPSAVESFKEKYEEAFAILSSLPGQIDQITTLRLDSQHQHIANKHMLIKNLYSTIAGSAHVLSLDNISANTSKLQDLCARAAEICILLDNVNGMLETTKVGMYSRLSELEKNVNLKTESIKNEEKNRDSVAGQNKRVAELETKMDVLYDLQTDMFSKREALISVERAHNELEERALEAHDLHALLSSLYSDNCISVERLDTIKSHFLSSKVALHLPSILSLAIASGAKQEVLSLASLWEALSGLLTTWEDRWNTLLDSLKYLGYSTADELLQRRHVFSSDQLCLLTDVLSFLVAQSNNYINIEPRWLTATHTMHEALNALSSNVATGLQSWLTSSGNIANLTPTLRRDFNVYMEKRHDLPDNISAVIRDVFSGFLDGYMSSTSVEMATMINVVITSFSSFAYILPIAIIMQHVCISAQELRDEVSELTAMSNELRKMRLRGEEIVSNGTEATTILFDLLPGAVMVPAEYTLGSIEGARIRYHVVDTTAFNALITTTFNQLSTAEKALREKYSDSKSTAQKAEALVQKQAPAFNAAKEAVAKAEKAVASVKTKIEELLRKFVESSPDNRPYSKEYALELNSRYAQAVDRISQYEGEVEQLKQQLSDSKKEVDSLCANDSLLSGFLSHKALSRETFRGILSDLQRIQDIPTEETIEAYKKDYNSAQVRHQQLMRLFLLLNRYDAIKSPIETLMQILHSIFVETQNQTQYASCEKIQELLTEMYGASTSDAPINTYCIKGLTERLDTLIKTYKDVKANLTKELSYSNGILKERESGAAKAKEDFQAAMKYYVEKRTTFTVNKGAHMLSQLMQKMVKDFKNTILRKINSKLQTLWRSCYARVGSRQNEITSVRLTIVPSKKGGVPTDCIELQAVCPGATPDALITRSFRDTCSSGQQVLLSILLRLAFSYILMPPFSFIILDEPTNYLDKENSKNLAHALADFIQNEKSLQVVVITHSTEFRDTLITSSNSASARIYEVSNGAEGSEIKEVSWSEVS